MSDDYVAKCQAILEWAEKNTRFDTSAVEGILEWISEHDITSNQEIAIDNIINGFKIDI